MATYSQVIVKGTVKDKSGEPIIGASVALKGTTKGTITNIDGEYEIAARSSQTLVFSYMGYSTQQINVNDRKVINVVLQENQTALDEVVVVGYGTQRRRNIVGAVENVSGEILANKPNAYLLRSMQGQIPGVNITMVDGKPSRSASINIRGNVQSIGSGGSTLCLIDGVEGDLTAMNPDDVESISVLKDASSCAVYGARGAFGVVLVTTKKAKQGKISVNYNGNFSLYRQTVELQYETDGLKWYNNFFEAYTAAKHANPGGINNFFPWSLSWAQEYVKRMEDPDQSYDNWNIDASGKYQYFGANTDWMNEFYRKQTYGQQHNISITGGGDIASFIVSARYYDQDGIYRIGDEKFRQINVRAKGTINITKWLTLENNTDFVRRTYHQPNGYNSLLIPRLVEHQGYPMTLKTNPDGSWTAAAVMTGYAGMADGTTYRDNFKYDMKNSTFLTAKLFDNQLVAKADFSYLFNHSERIDVLNPTSYNLGPDIVSQYPNNSVKNTLDSNTEYYAANASLTYQPKLSEDHSLTLLGGWNIEHKKFISTRLSRDGLLDASKPNYSLMDGINYTLLDNGSYAWGFMGLFYRASYAYKGKYLAEVSGRYDGSSKFPTSQQWGFFPSASLGWRLSEESFMKNLTWLDNLKIRFSAGSAGNGNVSPYAYLAKMSVAKATVLTNGTQEAYTGVPSTVPDGLTWEKATTYDVGLDMDMFNGRLNFTGDIYRKSTSDMYVVGAEIPAVAGYSAPKGNYADMRTDGYELALGWKDNFRVANKPFNYNVRLSFWDSTSKITRYTSKTNILPTIYSTAYYEGMTLGEIWGYHVDGLFATDEEAAAWGGTAQVNTFWSGDAKSWNAGDLKFADLNGDGIVSNESNTLEKHGDLRKIGNTTPRYHYGINLGANWNGFGLSVFFQGIGKRDWYPGGESAYFWGQYNRPYTAFSLPWQNENRWTEENQNVNAYWPRLRSYLASTGRGTMRLANDRYLQNARYCRLKNITIDYTLPKNITKKLCMNNIRFYISGDNLYFWSPLKKYAKNYDPEQITAGDSDYGATPGTNGDGYGYPQTKSVSFGVNITY